MQVQPPTPNIRGFRKIGARIDRAIGDEARFIRNWIRQPLVTGAVAPSGRYLARAMARFVDPQADGPVIELGPGTGPVTEALIAHGVAPQRLVLVEYDEAFCRLLQRRFPLARVIQGDAYDLPRTLHGLLGQRASAIVSSLPLLTKPEGLRASLLEQAFDLSESDAPFIQFTYGATPPIPRKLSSAAFAFSAESTPQIWLNLPPARVWVYRRGAADAPTRHRTRADELMRALRVRGAKARRDLKRAAGKLGGKGRA